LKYHQGGCLKNLSKVIGTLLVLLPVAAAQQTRISREGDSWAQETAGNLGSAKTLRVKVDMGSVRVQGGSQAGISYVIRNRSYTASEEKARHEFDSYKISTYLRGDTAWIVGDWQGGRPHKFSGDFIINVPREMDLVKIETAGGNVTTSSVGGRVDTQSGGGSIRLDEIGGAVNAETGGGGIDADDIGGDLSLHTGGGSIKISSAKGRINAETGGGSVKLISGMQDAVLETGGGGIEVERCAGRVKATTGGGSIDLGDIGGPAEIETGGGSIRLSSAKGAVRAETGGGSIELNGVPSARAETGAGAIVAKFIGGGDRTDSLLETSAGDITVYLAPNLGITVRASIELANGHKIHSDFSEIQVRSDGCEYCPKSASAEGSLNGGGPVLKVRTTTGDILIRRTSH
jgi:DUF4097 and DUF4098 domain-containing protein YvlB